VGRRLPLGRGIARGAAVSLIVDGRLVNAHAGETVATVLIAEGRIATRRTAGGQPRGVFCGMGACFDCLVVVDGVPNTRACMTFVAEGMDVRRQDVYAAASADT
jgi:predicted molibdopterin-dependent oxidoreductase YjgC